MSAEPDPLLDFAALERTLAKVINNAGSLDEIEAWLRSQPYLRSLHRRDYLLKSNPPQRDFIAEFSADGGSTVTKIINIFDYGSHFRFHKLRER
jgi:hypothetical protein